MINLRYHIVSLTAVFLAIGIGLTLGSTFLDQATVDNLEGQLGSLESSLENRSARIENLEADLAEATAMSDALDEQGAGLLTGRLTDVPVVIVSARGADEAAVRGSLQALVVAGADVDGIWWVTDQFLLDEEGQVADLADALGADSTDPSRLRRMAIEALGAELRERQLRGLGEITAPDGTEPVDDTTTADPDAATDPDPETPDPGTPDPESPDPESPDPESPDPESPDPGSPDPDGTTQLDIIDALFRADFLEFEAVPGGPEVPAFVDGTRMLVAGGSADIPDDVVLEPLVTRMASGATTPVLAVVGSAGIRDRVMADAVSVIRQDETLRGLVSTVDTLEHFDGWAAMVLALADLDDGVVGHYGLGEGASRLLPSQRTP